MLISSAPRPKRFRNRSIQRLKSVNQLKKSHSKSAENKLKRKMIQNKKNFKLSPKHLNLLIQEQRITDLKQIRSSIALSHYYDSLMSLFGIIYSTSQIITSNIFDCKKQTTHLSGLKFVGLFFSLYESIQNSRQFTRLRVMTRNIMKMGITQKIFEERIQFICRKITLNYNMQNRIQMAFLDVKLQSFWTKLKNFFMCNEQIQMLQEMYQLAQEKMAFWDFHKFLNNYLVNQGFYETLRSCTRKQREIDPQEQIYNFTFEFLIIQIFCFYYQQEDLQLQQKKKNICSLI